MTDSDQAIKIQVTTAADTSALKRTADALKQVTDAGSKGASAATLHAQEAGLAGGGARELFLRLLASLAESAARSFPGPGIRIPPEAAPHSSGALPPPVVPPPAESQFPEAKSVGEPGAIRADRGNSAAPRAETFAHSPAGEQLEDGGKAAAAFEHGAKINADLRALINSLSSLLGVTHSSTKEILAIIADGHRGQAGLRREIEELKRAVAEVARRSANPINPGPP